MRPESLMMSYGYDPQLSEGAIKSPIFQTSTFVFKSAEEGKRFFEIAYGIKEKKPEEQMGLIYSRLNNPDLEILEDRLTLWDDVEEAAVFDSGMSAISTMILSFLRPGDVILHSEPVYGGTDYFIKNILPSFGIKQVSFTPKDTEKEIEDILKKHEVEKDRLKMVYIETPANPTNDLVDIEMCAAIARKHSTGENKCILAVDNTFLGPIFSNPTKHGADLVIYSATKFIAGHSDLIAGVCLGNSELMTHVKGMRTFLGTMAGPYTSWLMMRSLETLQLRMTRMCESAKIIARYLDRHPKVEKVYFLDQLEIGSRQAEIFKKQCTDTGSMISFDIMGGEKEAFKFLNALKLMKLAVSLGGTESLAEHPASMTHSDIAEEMRDKMNITDKMVRLSIGVEHPEDLIADLEQALSEV